MIRDFALSAAALGATFAYAWWERRARRRRHEPEYLVGAFDRAPLVPAQPGVNGDRRRRRAA